MNKYRLKKEAVQFFKEKHATAIYSFDDWEKLGVDTKALEKIEDAYITYGHRDKDNKGASLSGWSQDDGQHFHLTLNFPSVKYKEHDEFSNGRVLRKLLDRIQNQINNFYSDFANDELK